MKRRLLILFAIFWFANHLPILAQTLTLKQNNPTGVYKRGEKIKITALAKAQANDTLWVKVLKNNNQVIQEKAISPVTDSMMIFEGSSRKPCSIMIDAKLNGERQVTGTIINPQKLKPGTKRPSDFDAYWKWEKQNMKSLKMEVHSARVELEESGYACYDTEINCTGSKPARGYFAKPEKAKFKSLPIVLLVHAAGVKGSWCKSKVEDALRYAKMGNGALCFDLNAHGMLNGQPDEYYENLESGELKNYYAQGLENREDFYFRGMYLRLLRTIDFLTRQPEWDKKRIIVIGESQGGGQALAAAGLDSRVTAVVATVPAMCDFGGTLAGRKGGWPQPFERAADMEKMKKVLPYFDTAHLLKNSKATIVVEIGLSDQTCPSTSIYAAINQANGKRIVYPVTYREHSWPTTEQRKYWEPMVFDQKNQFVANFLK